MWVGLVYLHSGLLPASELERGAKKKKPTIKAMFLFLRKSSGTRLTHPRFFFPFGSLFFLSTLPMLRPVVLQHVHNTTASRQGISNRGTTPLFFVGVARLDCTRTPY